MVVYADILLVLNLIVDYFLILASAKLLRRRVKTFRAIISSLLGALSSLYIFLPQLSILAELLFKLSVCSIMAATAFGTKSIKQYLKAFAVLFLVTCGYAGSMLAVWHIFKPGGMVINNSVVYFNISPLVLVGATVISYLIFIIFNRIFSRTAFFSSQCEIIIESEGKSTKLSAILDTGNSVVDLFSKSEIIIADKKAVKRIFGDIDEAKVLSKNRYRAVPFTTVSGADMLDGFRCDRAVVKGEGKTVTLEKPILAVSKLPINESYNAIANPKILE